jgi:hypothetical protein
VAGNTTMLVKLGNQLGAIANAAIACTTCHSLVLEGDHIVQGLRIVLSDLRDSATRTLACPACALLWQAVCAIVEQEASAPDVSYEAILVEGRPRTHSGPMVVHLYPHPTAFGKTSKTLQFYTTAGKPPIVPSSRLRDGLNLSP